MDMVGGFKPSEKYEFVNWDDEIPNIWKSKKCSKPPTRISIYGDLVFGWDTLGSSENIAPLSIGHMNTHSE